MTYRYLLRRPVDEGERERVVASLWATGCLGVWDRPEEGELVAWFGEPTPSAPPDGEWVQEAERDWLAEWKAGLEPVVVGGLTVAPSWVGMEPDEHTIVLDPGMAFGTGHHATTRLCVAALARTGVRGARVLDVGTGTGILAIAAARLGARDVVAIDNDPEAVTVARENLERNGVGVDLRTGDLDVVRDDPPFDAVVANLNTEALIDLATELGGVTRPGGHLVVSGVASERARRVIAAHADCELVAREDEEGWAAVTLRRR